MTFSNPIVLDKIFMNNYLKPLYYNKIYAFTQAMAQ